MGGAILVFDDDCGFCTWWAEYFADRSDVRLIGYSQLEPELRDRLPAEYDTCSHLLTDETIFSCGASVEQAFLETSAGRLLQPLVGVLRRIPGYARLREWSYRRVAGNRGLAGRIVSTSTDEDPTG